MKMRTPRLKRIEKLTRAEVEDSLSKHITLAKSPDDRKSLLFFPLTGRFQVMLGSTQMLTAYGIGGIDRAIKAYNEIK